MLLLAVIIAVAKFREGSWMVIVLIPIMVYMLNRINIHYLSVREQLKIPEEEYDSIDFSDTNYQNKIIVPIESVNRASVRALRYAISIADNVVAFSVAIDDESARDIREKYDRLHTNIPLVVKLSPYRKVVDPLIRFIESSEYDYVPGDMITVLLSQFNVTKWWQRLLHNRTRSYIERRLLKHKHIVVSTIPLQLKEDKIGARK